MLVLDFLYNYDGEAAVEEWEEGSRTTCKPGPRSLAKSKGRMKGVVMVGSIVWYRSETLAGEELVAYGCSKRHVWAWWGLQWGVLAYILDRGGAIWKERVSYRTKPSQRFSIYSAPLFTCQRVHPLSGRYLIRRRYGHTSRTLLQLLLAS